MDTRSTLHWSALLLALFATGWMLVSVIDLFIVVLPVFALAGFILLLVHARRLDADRRPMVAGGAILGIAAYALWMLLFLLSQPVSIKNVGNSAPPAWFGTIADAIGAYLPLLGALAILIGLWALWRTRERALAALGTIFVLVVQLTALLRIGAGEETISLLLQLLFALGFLLLVIALVLPLFDPDGSGSGWHGREAV